MVCCGVTVEIVDTFHEDYQGRSRHVPVKAFGGRRHAPVKAMIVEDMCW